MADSISAREHLAWLLWCVGEGYLKPEDRGENWMAEDLTTMHPADVELRHHLLVMADEVLAAQVEGHPIVREVDGRIVIDWPEPKPSQFPITAEAFEALVARANHE
jgi:hypothetical protein